MLIQGINAVLNLNVQIAPDVPYSLENAQVSIILEKPDSKATETISGQIIDAAAGQAQVLLTPQALSEGGTYKYQVHIVFPDNTVSKSAISAFYVAESLQMATS